MRVGFGYDIHQLISGRHLLLAGVEIPSPVGESGHSDGDVLIHAVIDALLGSCGAGDIGTHFPDSDPAWKDAASRGLLIKALGIVHGYRPINVDCTVCLEKPRLSSYIPAIREHLAQDLGLDTAAISVKAKTGEGLGPVGSGRAVEAYAVMLVE